MRALPSTFFCLLALVVLSLAASFSACGGDDCEDDSRCAPDGDADIDADSDTDVDADADGDGDGCPDVDHDLQGDAPCGGDCDPANPATYPGAPDNETYSWASETISDVGGDGPHATLAIGADGALHVAYVSSGLHYASNASGAWVSETVDPEGATASSLALDPEGAVHITYLSSAGDEMRHATTATGEWSIEAIEGGLYIPADPAMKVGPDGTVHLAYANWNGTYEIRYAENSAGPFAVEVVATGRLEDSAGVTLAIDPDGFPHLGYQDFEGSLVHAVRDSLGWAHETIAENSGPGMLAVDPQGRVHAAFHSLAGGGTGDVTYGLRGEEGWDTTIVQYGGGLDPSIAVDAEGTPHVVFGGQLQYATDRHGPWEVESVASSSYPDDVAIDSLGGIHVLGWAGYTSLVHTWRMPPDGVDQNCDGVDGIDADADGFASRATGGEDCDDAAAATYPDAADPPGDAIDQNCDGLGGP